MNSKEQILRIVKRMVEDRELEAKREKEVFLYRLKEALKGKRIVISHD